MYISAKFLLQTMAAFGPLYKRELSRANQSVPRFCTSKIAHALCKRENKSVPQKNLPITRIERTLFVSTVRPPFHCATLVSDEYVCEFETIIFIQTDTNISTTVSMFYRQRV
jgi:hypothetical protein